MCDLCIRAEALQLGSGVRLPDKSWGEVVGRWPTSMEDDNYEMEYLVRILHSGALRVLRFDASGCPYYSPMPVHGEFSEADHNANL